MLPPFASTRHFLDLIISDNDYKMRLLQDITKEKYYITKFTHTSFIDIDEITYLERNMILKFITEEKEAEQKQLMKLKNSGGRL